MKLSATRLFPLVLMLTLALLSFWLERASRESPASPVERSHDPDYSVERFTLTEFSDDAARDTAANDRSACSKCWRAASTSSAWNEQPEQPSFQSGPSMKCCTKSWLRPAKRSPSETGPSGPAKT